MIEFKNLAKDAELSIEEHGSPHLIDGFEVPVHFNGFLKSTDKLIDLRSRCSYLIQLIDNNLSLYEKHGDFSQEWNDLRHKQYYEEQESQSRKRALKKDKTLPVGFVYLMIDRINTIYKIGFSKDPKYREATLQSEKPSIELLFAFPGTIKDEKRLHEKYQDFRTRGEWFKIPEEGVADLIMTFQSHAQ